MTLALDEGTRNRRRELVLLPPKLTSLGACMSRGKNGVARERSSLRSSGSPLPRRVKVPVVKASTRSNTWFCSRTLMKSGAESE